MDDTQVAVDGARGATGPWVLAFARVGDDALARVGGKGANLAVLARAGFAVPEGFCVTTEAFRAFCDGAGELGPLFDRLDALDADDTDAVRAAGAAMRARLEQAPVPRAVADAVTAAWESLGARGAFAVRSSATAEDLPGASFAGQQDTYLNVVGRDALLDRVRACWASLFTDRAIAYRARNGFGHRRVQLAVVVQRMVLPEAAGVLFTADPVDGRRHVVSIDAGFGLGEALVSGLSSPDNYRVDTRVGAVVGRTIADKSLAIRPRPEGGTTREELTGEARSAAVLTDAQVLALAALGRRIEAHFGAPQDVEWCIERGALWVVQSRPITTLFPVPEPPYEDPGLRVFLSFGHLQVMTAPMPPLAHAVLARIVPVQRDEHGASRALLYAGGRVFIDATNLLHTAPFDRFFPRLLQIGDVLMSEALQEVAARPEFRGSAPTVAPARVRGPFLRFVARVLPSVVYQLVARRPEGATGELLAYIDRWAAAARARVEAHEDPAARLREAMAVLGETFPEGIPPILPRFAPGMLSLGLLRVLLRGRGVEHELDTFARGLEGNVTTEMDLALGDLADAARATPAVVAHLRAADPRDALRTARDVPGGAAFADAAERFLARYGMRGPSEIDVTRPRFRDDPSPLVQVLVGNLARKAPGAHRAHHAAVARESLAAARTLVAKAPLLLRPLVRRLVRVARALVAVREHPKFLIVQSLAIAREAALRAAGVLRERGAIDRLDDAYFLRPEELLAALEGALPDARALVAARRAELDHARVLTPPRVITSEGECVTPRATRGPLPDGALAGTGASAGVAEGLARVVLDPARTALLPGEILVAPFTDPGWTPLFINAAGLVMEVGGLMTHGSVVAREYGIPAVVCVPDATKKIRTGQRVRVDGSRGVVELLDEPGHAGT